MVTKNKKPTVDEQKLEITPKCNTKENDQATREATNEGRNREELQK